MALLDRINHTRQRILDEHSSARIVLLHPDSQYRSVVIAHLANSSQPIALYYSLGPDDIELSSFLFSMCHDLSRQIPVFGRHLNLLSESEIGPEVPYQVRFDNLLNAFIRDLSEISEKRFFLILDEYDRSDESDEIQRFIERSADLLPENCTLILNGRTLPRIAWIALVAKRRAVVINDDHVITRNLYGPQTQSHHRLQIRALGPGFVTLNDVPIDTWEGHLPRLLFFFALDRPIVTRSEICQAFWPDLDDDQAVNVFHVTKRRLHKALEMDVLLHEDNHYRLNPELELDYDVARFVTAIAEGRRASRNESPEYWQEAIQLYGGEFLQGHIESWIKERRKDYASGFVEAHLAMADLRTVEDRADHALAHLGHALSAAPERYDIHERYMKLLATQGRRSEAVAHFQRLAAEHTRKGIPIPEFLVALYNSIIG